MMRSKPFDEDSPEEEIQETSLFEGILATLDTLLLESHRCATPTLGTARCRTPDAPSETNKTNRRRPDLLIELFGCRKQRNRDTVKHLHASGIGEIWQGT